MVPGWIAAVTVLLAILFFWTSRRSRAGQASPESIVLLLREPKKINGAMLAEIFSEESGVTVESITPDQSGSQEHFVMSKKSDSRFVVCVNKTMFIAYSVTQAYGD